MTPDGYRHANFNELLTLIVSRLTTARIASETGAKHSDGRHAAYRSAGRKPSRAEPLRRTGRVLRESRPTVAAPRCAGRACASCTLGDISCARPRPRPRWE